MPRQNIQNIIMKLVSSARSITQSELVSSVERALHHDPEADRKVKPEYIIKRTLKRLHDTGKLSVTDSEGIPVVSLTDSGAEKLHRSNLSTKQNMLPASWDGLWRLVLLDFESDDKKARDAVRYMLKKANFFCLKQSVWVTPHNLEGFIAEMKYHMKLTSEVMFIVANRMDNEIEREVREYFALDQTQNV